MRCRLRRHITYYLILITYYLLAITYYLFPDKKIAPPKTGQISDLASVFECLEKRYLIGVFKHTADRQAEGKACYLYVKGL